MGKWGKSWGPVSINKYVLARDRVLPETLSICDFWECLGNLSPGTLIDLCKFDLVP